MQDKNNNKKILMAMVGAYLIYTGGSLIMDVTKGEPENAMLFILAGAAFVIVGALTVFLNMKEYITAVKADVMITEDNEEELEEYHDEDVPVRKGTGVIDVKLQTEGATLAEVVDEELSEDDAEDISQTSSVVLDLSEVEETDSDEE